MPEAVNIMAKVAAGGDRAKLEKMMKAGQVDAFKYLPLFFEELGKRAEPFLGAFFESIQASRGRAAKGNEDFFKNFMSAGGVQGVKTFFDTWAQLMKDSKNTADYLGNAFYKASLYLSAVMLAPKEISDWFSGAEKKGNFLTALFGKSSENEFLSTIKTTFSQIKSYITSSMDESTKSVKNLKKEFSLLTDFVEPLLRDLGNLFSLAQAYNEGGVKALVERNAQIETMGKARTQAEKEAESTYQRTGVKVPREQIKNRTQELYQQMESNRVKQSGNNASWFGMPIGSNSLEDINNSPWNPENWGKYIGDGIRSYFTKPEIQNPVSYTPTPLSWKSPLLPNMSNNEIPSSTVNMVKGMPGNSMVVYNNFQIKYGDVGSNIDLESLKSATHDAISEATNRIMGTMLPTFPNTFYNF